MKPTLKHLFKEGIAAGAVVMIAWSAVLAVVLTGFNLHAFTRLDLLKVNIVLLVWFIGQGILLGAGAGLALLILALLTGVRPFYSRLPWLAFSLLYLLLMAAGFRYNPYLLKAFIQPSSLLAPVLLLLVFAAGAVALVSKWLYPVKALTLCLNALLLLLLLLAMPLSLGRKSPAGKSSEPLPAGILKPLGYKVVLVGIDGISWEIADQLLSEGRMPALSSLIQKGVRSHLLTYEPTESPQIWTTMATGKGPETHGVQGFTWEPVPFTEIQYNSLKIPGRMGMQTIHNLVMKRLLHSEVYPLNSSMRREKALWNIFTEQGLSSGVLNWWASWPAEKINGLLVSDRVIYYRETAKLGFKPADSGLTWPKELADELGHLLLTPEEVSDADYHRYMILSDEEVRRMRQAPYHYFSIESEFAYCISLQESTRRITERLMTEHPEMDFWAIYTKGTDIFSHTAMKYSVRVNDPAVSSEDRLKYGQVIDQAYIDADRLLEEIIKRSSPESIFWW